MTRLFVTSLTFYSQVDESFFFNWLNVIAGIIEVSGVRDTIIIDVVSNINDDSLRELIALFTRYGLDLSQLRKFVSDSNARWFDDPMMFWHSLVFDGK